MSFYIFVGYVFVVYEYIFEIDWDFWIRVEEECWWVVVCGCCVEEFVGYVFDWINDLWGNGSGLGEVKREWELCCLYECVFF